MNSELGEPILHKLECVVLTATRLIIYRDGQIYNIYSLQDLTDVKYSEGQSFRNRGMGLVFAIVLLCPSLFVLGTIIANDNYLALFGFNRGGIGAMCGAVFGLWLLYKIVAYKSNPWLVLVERGITRRVPLCDTPCDDVEQLVDRIKHQINLSVKQINPEGDLK